MAIINSLEYVDIRNSIISFLKQDPYYKDFNFEASNISRLMNLLAYNSMYNGYYIKMLHNESMPDSAKTITALIGHANTRNYLSKFISASRSLISVKVSADNIDTNEVPYIQLKRGTSFKGTDKDNKTVYFILPYDVVLNYNAESNEYIGDDMVLVQGIEKTITYNITELNQKYIVTDPQCDQDNIVVRIKSNAASNVSFEYIRNDSFYDVSESDTCYYITASTSGLYQIHFGRDIFGREPKLGEVINITYIKTLGADCNDVNQFSVVTNKTISTEVTDINFYPQGAITVTTLEAATGGLNAETIDELRFGVLNSNRIRGRAVTPEDIKSIILSEFRDVESINVWSGADSIKRRYGKTFISIKPKTSELLTSTGKEKIADILINRYGIISRTDLVFVDPFFTNIIMNIKFKVNRAITSENTSTIKARVISAAQKYNKEILSKFDAAYYESDFTNAVRGGDVSILSVFTEKVLQKVVNLNYTSSKIELEFGNVGKAMYSDPFAYGTINVKLKNIDSDIYIVNADTGTKISIVGQVDFTTGSMTINIPTYVSIQLLNVYMEIVYPDVSTLEDNIIRIKSIDAVEIN